MKSKDNLFYKKYTMNKVWTRCVVSIALAFVRFAGLAKRSFPGSELLYPTGFVRQKSFKLEDLGKSYRITDYGVLNDSTIIQTQQIQAVIDKASQEGGGVIYIPQGTFFEWIIIF